MGVARAREREEDQRGERELLQLRAQASERWLERYRPSRLQKVLLRKSLVYRLEQLELIADRTFKANISPGHLQKCRRVCVSSLFPSVLFYSSELRN